MKIFKLLGDLIILSILWVIGSLPIITIGASTHAIMSVCENKIRKKETNIINDFFQSYKKDFFKSLKSTLIIMTIWFATLNYALSVISNLSEGFNFNVIILLIALFETVMISLYLCGLNSKYHLGSLGTLKNAIIFVHAYFKESVQAFTLISAALFVTASVPFFIIILPGAVAMIASGFLNLSIEKYKERLSILNEIKKNGY